MKAKMRRCLWSACFLLAIVVSIGFAATAAASETVRLTFDGTRDYDEAADVLTLVNQNRSQAGVQELVMNAALQETAMQRAEELAIFNSHTRPDGSLCFTAFPMDYGRRAENIAIVSGDADAVMSAWMNSSGHRANILDGQVNEIGIGCFEQDGRTFWAQCFSSQREESPVVRGKKNVTATVDVLWENLNFTLAPSAVELEEGQQITLQMFNINKEWKYCETPINGESFVWTSDSECAAVSAGTVVGKSAGSATVTVSLNGVPLQSAAVTVNHVPGPAATCTEAQSCTVCQAVLAEALGHSAGAAATCTTAQKCTRCGAELQKALGHSAGAAPTCTEAQKCTRCGEELQKALGHSAGAAATCTTAQKCTRCGVELQKALGHTGGKATCREKAVCTRCRTAYGSYGGHTWGSWKTASKATVLASAKQTRSCKVCGKKEKRSSGSKLKSKGKVTASSVLLKVRQSTSAVKVSGMARGDSVKSVTPKNKSIVKVTKVKKTGTFKLTGLKAGSTYVQIKLAGGKKLKVKVKVQKGTVKTTAVKGVPKKLTLKKGKKKKLEPTLAPITSQQKLIYSSSNKAVATVNAKGQITAKKKGTATITVRSGSKKASCKVKVN